MTDKEIRKKVSLFRKKFGVSECNLINLKEASEKQGYTVIEFNHIFNDEPVQTVIDELALSDVTLRSKGFTYADENYRLLFLHEDLSEEEKIMVLAHENGHIFLQHMASESVIGRDVREEHDANEFAHYLTKRTSGRVLSDALTKHKKLLLTVTAVVLVLIAGVLVFNFVGNKEEAFSAEYYVTLTGSKYHEKDCIFVKNKDNIRRITKEEFESGDYEPCKTCLP